MLPMFNVRCFSNLFWWSRSVEQLLGLPICQSEQWHQAKCVREGCGNTLVKCEWNSPKWDAIQNDIKKIQNKHTKLRNDLGSANETKANAMLRSGNLT